MSEYILVTGGAGYIGSHTVQYLLGQKQKILILDNLEHGHREFLPPGAEFVLADLTDKAALALVFSRYPIQAVVHFAAYAYVGESVQNPAKYYRNNVVGTLNLLDAMHRAHVQHIVFSSTCATYGVPEESPIEEHHPQAPINPYGMSKLMIEAIFADYAVAYGLRWCALRYFNAAGADPQTRIGEWHDPETHLIPLVLDTAMGLRPAISVFGSDYPTPDGTCVRDYIHVTDLAQAHFLALAYLQEGGTSRAFNLGNGNGHSVLQVIECARKITGHAIPIQMEPRRAGDPPALVGSARQAKEILNWNPQYADLETIIQTAWQWHLKRHKLRH